MHEDKDLYQESSQKAKVNKSLKEQSDIRGITGEVLLYLSSVLWSMITFLNQNTSWQHRAKEEGCFDLLVLVEAACAPTWEAFLLWLQGWTQRLKRGGIRHFPCLCVPLAHQYAQPSLWSGRWSIKHTVLLLLPLHQGAIVAFFFTSSHLP